MAKHMILNILGCLLLISRAFPTGFPGPPEIAMVADSNIVYVEYFLNSDPGYGNGTSVLVDASPQIDSLGFSVDISSLDYGFNYLYIRAKNSAGIWSLSNIRSFYKETVYTQPADIVYLEYFTGNDPGPGNGAQVSLSPEPNTDSINVVVDISDMPNGFHYLYFRSKDANGLWSFSNQKPIYKETVYPETADIVYAEYFLNEDPGKGNGSEIALMPSPNISGLDFSVDMTGYEKGFHFLYVRVKDLYNQWSLCGIKTIFLETREETHQDITYLEYFFDEDPGFGLGIEIPVTPGTPVATIVFDVDISELYNGFHRLYIRAEDASGKRSLTNVKSFYKEDLVTPEQDIVKIEYFFNDDPGEGNGTTLTFVPGPNIQNQAFIADVCDLPLGENHLYVRAKDESGKWSLTNVHTFELGCGQLVADFDLMAGCASLPAEFEDYSTGILSEAEYNWNFGDGSPEITGGSGNVFHTFADTGQYQVKLIVVNREDCIDSILKTVTIYPPPFVNAGNDQTVCTGAEIILSASFGQGTLSWDHDVTNGEPFVITESTTFTATVESEFGCGPISDQVTITVLQPPEVSAGGDATGCANENYQITLADASSFSTLQWTTTNGLGYFENGNEINATYHPDPDDPEVVELCLAAFPLNPCTTSATDCINLTLIPEAAVIITDPPTGTNLCASTIVEVTAIAENHSSVSWSTSGDGVFGDPASPLTYYIPGPQDLANQQVELCLQAMPLNGCTVAVSNCITLMVLPDPEINLEPEIWLDCSDFDFISNQWLPLAISAEVENAVSFHWLTSGDGYFDDSASAATNYNLGTQDQINGWVDLIFTAQAPDGCMIQISAYQTVHIPAQLIPASQSGWRGISSYIDLSEKTLPVVLEPVENNLLIIRDQYNNTYNPVSGINQIGNWSATGYMANFANPPACLPVYGDFLENKQVHLNKQVTYLPVLNDQPITIETLFAGHLEKIQSIYNWSNLKTWTPGNAEFDLLEPGFAYAVTLLNETDSFRVEFPPFSFEDSLVEVSISGRIVNSETGLPVENVELTPVGLSPVFTNANGEFVAQVPYAWSGTIIPIKNNWFFDPPELSVPEARVNIYDQDFSGIDNSCNPGWTYISTPNFHTIVIPLSANPEIFGEPLSEGDFIGVFFLDDNGEEQCGGYVQWPGTGNVQVTAFGDDLLTDEKDGFAVDEPMLWKVYDCDTQNTWDALATYDPLMPESSGIFQPFGFSGLLNLQTQLCQQFQLAENWNDLSLFIEPFDQDVAGLIAPMQNNLVIFKNLNSIYWPSGGINTVGDWDTQSGYVMKTSAEATIQICGAPITDSLLNLFVQEGNWHYLPVISGCPVNCDELFGPEADKITIVKELLGTEVWWPEAGIFTLQELQPGQAYEIRIETDVELGFPNCQDIPVMKSGRLQASMNTVWGTILYSPVTHTIAVPAHVAQKIPDDFLITVQDEFGRIYGISGQAGTSPFAITVFGDDPSTNSIEGMAEGMQMQVGLYNPKTGTKYPVDVDFDETMPNDNIFRHQGLSAFKQMNTSSVEGLQIIADKVFVYPNPSNGIFHVKCTSGTEGGSPDQIKWMITNVYGYAIEKGAHFGKDFTIDLSSHPKGIYYLKIKPGERNLVKKLVLQ